MIADLLLGVVAIATIGVACVLELRHVRRIQRDGRRVKWPILY